MVDAARLIDRAAGTSLESRLDADLADLADIHGPGRQDGLTLLDAALAAVGERRDVERRPRL